MVFSRGGLVALLIACAGCSKAHRAVPDGGRIDAAVVDAAPPPFDAAAGRAGREILTGGGQVQGGTMRMDVEIGHPVEQRRASGGGKTVEGAAVIKP
jgi:hypothetical protein